MEVVAKRVAKKDEPDVNRRAKRIADRLQREMEIQEKSTQKGKSGKREKKQAEAEEEQYEEPWEFDGLLPEWTCEGSLVWAKVAGFPWWPALVNAPEDKPEVKRRPSKPDLIWVYNLGAGNFSEVQPTKGLQPYVAETIAKFGDIDKLKPSMRAQFKKALQQATAILFEEGGVAANSNVPLEENAVATEERAAPTPSGKRKVDVSDDSRAGDGRKKVRT